MKTQYMKVLEVMHEYPKVWLPSYFFVGGKKGINGSVHLSYKAPARLSEIYAEHSYFIERRKTNGRCYEYRLLKKFLKNK